MPTATLREAIDTATGVATSTSEQITQVVKDSQEIILAALAEYATSSDLESFKEAVSSQLSIMADEIELRFTSTSERIEDVNGDLQAQYSSSASISVSPPMAWLLARRGMKLP